MIYGKEKVLKGRVKKWKFLIAFAIKSQTPAPPPPPFMALISIHFLRHFFLLQLNLTYIKRILHLVSVKNITFKSCYMGSKYSIWARI